MTVFTKNTTEEEVIDYLSNLLTKHRCFDSIDLIDRLEGVKSPLVTITKAGDRKLKPSIISAMKNKFRIEYEPADHSWYLIK